MLLDLSLPLLVYGVLLACQVGLVRSYVYENASQVFTAPVTPTVIDAGEVQKPDFWDTCVDRGLQNYWAWQKAINDIPAPGIPADVFATDLKSKTGFDTSESDILKLLDKSTDPELYTQVEVKWPKDGCRPPGADPAEFTCFMSVTQGVFVIVSAYRRDLPKEWSFARVAFWTWQRVRETELDAASPTLPVPDLSSLEYLITVGTINWKTELVMKYALSLVDAQPNDVKTFNFESPPPEGQGLPDLEQQPFWALIGSTNGRAIIQVLIEQKESMQDKRLESVTVRRQTGGGGLFEMYQLWGKYGKDP